MKTKNILASFIVLLIFSGCAIITDEYQASQRKVIAFLLEDLPLPEDAKIIKGSSLTLDYQKLGYTFIAYVGIFLQNTSQTKFVLQRIKEIPHVTVAHITTGKFNIFCKIRAKSTTHAKEIIFKIDDIEGIYRTETMISLEESINDKKRLMHSIFNELQ